MLIMNRDEYILDQSLAVNIPLLIFDSILIFPINVQ